MAVIKNLDIRVLNAPAAIFEADIETDKVQLDSGQAAHFVIATGEGAAVSADASVYGVRGDGDEVLIRTAEIRLGAGAENKIVVAARELAHSELCSVFLKIPSADSDIVGTVFVVLTNERYSS